VNSNTLADPDGSSGRNRSPRTPVTSSDADMNAARIIVGTTPVTTKADSHDTRVALPQPMTFLNADEAASLDALVVRLESATGIQVVPAIVGKAKVPWKAFGVAARCFARLARRIGSARLGDGHHRGPTRRSSSA
jgi:hypothetical protein